MIIVDISVPIIGETYNFSLDENVPVNDVIDEVVEIISQKEGGFNFVESKNMDLFLCETNRILSRKHTLFENEVVNGKKLLLV